MSSNGYLRVFLRKEGKTHTVYAHRAVCAAFKGPCPQGYQCRHLDNNRQNNRPSNLEWSTKADNEADKKKFGTLITGEKAKHAVLTEEIVKAARERARLGEQIEIIAKSLSINPRVMADAVTGRRWAWLPGALAPFSTRRRFKDSEIIEIREMCINHTHAAVAEKFGVSRQAVTNIISGGGYPHVKNT